MATSRDSSLGYKTYVVGTVKPVVESNKIIVYNQYYFKRNVPDYTNISLYNINRIYDLITTSYRNNQGRPVYALLTKPEGDDAFYYRYADFRGIEGFNVIIYLSNFDNSPIGYTVFLRTQGKDRNIRIKIDLESTVLGGIKVSLRNSLAPLRSANAIERVFTGDELWDYTSPKTIYSELSSITPIPGYTSHLTAFNNGNAKRNIYQTNYLVRRVDNNIELSKLGITKDLEINPFTTQFTNHQVSYFGDDLALYSWKKEMYEEEGEEKYKLLYSITSLTERNIFGRQIYYTPNLDDDATAVIKDFSGDVDYFAGNYIVLKNGTILDISNNNNIVPGTDVSGYINFIDPLDPTCKIYSYNSITYNNVFQIIPELSWIYLNVKDYMRRYGIKVLRKIGSWFILKLITRNENTYILTNQNTLYHLTEEDYKNLIIVNDSVFMLKEDDYYLMYFLREGEFMTERYRALKRGTTIEIDTDLDVYFSNTNLVPSEDNEEEQKKYEADKQEDDTYRAYFTQNKIARIFKVFPVYDTVLDLFRKNYYEDEELTVPDIIGGCDGLLFYIQDNILMYI